MINLIPQRPALSLRPARVAALAVGALAATAIAQPANNNCSAAAPLAKESSVTGNLTTATNDGSATCGSSGGNRDVWYRFTNDGCPRTVVFTTAGSRTAANQIDTVLSAYTACGGAQIVCDDDGAGNRDSRIQVNLAASQSVLLRVSHYSSSIGTGDFTLVARVQGGDECASPVGISGEGLFPFDTNCSTTSGVASCISISRDNWYCWTPNAPGDYVITTCGQAGFDTVLDVFQGCGCPTAPAVACSDDACDRQSRVCFAAVPGQQYAIRIGSYSSTAGGTGNISISKIIPSYATAAVVNPANRHQYKILSATSWTTAQYLAADMGANLVTVNDAAENAYLASTFSPFTTAMWLGFNDAATEGAFVWASGEAPGYTNWSPGEPNNSGNEDYAVLYPGSPLWNDVPNVACAEVQGVIEITRPYIIRGPIVDPTTGNVYYGLSNSTWTQAQAYAQSLGGNLATVDNAAENNFLRSNFAGPLGRIWLGLNDVATEGSYVWASGGTSAYRNWSGGEPNNSGDEDYVMMYNNGTWNDVKDLANPPAIGEIFGCVEIKAAQPLAGPICNPVNSRFYYIMESANWPESQAGARFLGGNLATINNEIENDFVAGLASGPAWIGFTDADLESNFKWANGETVSFTKFAPAEPNNSGNEDYAQTSANGLWNDLPVTSRLIGIVEIDGTCCPADFNLDGGVDGTDVDAFFAAWGEGLPSGDFNGDGGVDGADVDAFFIRWDGGC